jgi:hypothetical protein
MMHEISSSYFLLGVNMECNTEMKNPPAFAVLVGNPISEPRI